MLKQSVQRFFIVLLLLLPVVAHAETLHDMRLWTAVVAQGPLAHKSPWRWYVDVQKRDRDKAKTMDQFQARPAVGYAISKRLSVWLGYAFDAKFSGGRTVKENRIWEQVQWTAFQRVATFSLRSRLEQRFFGTDGTGWRIRQQARWTKPIRSKSAFNYVSFEEVFVHLNDTLRTRRGLDQTRSFGGLGFTLNPKVRLDVGYLNQFVRTRPANKMNHAVSAILNLNF